MHLKFTRLPMVFEVESHASEDARGSFRRSWCQEAFAVARLDFAPAQASLATNTTAGTLRGLHWQCGQHAEQKLVRCLVGEIWDVAVDLRPDSPAFMRWHGLRLSAAEGNALFLPRGVAHGYVTLTPGAVVEYLIDRPYAPASARGARWNDPAFGIDWPVPPGVIAPRDTAWPDFQPEAARVLLHG